MKEKNKHGNSAKNRPGRDREEHRKFSSDEDRAERQSSGYGSRSRSRSEDEER